MSRYNSNNGGWFVLAAIAAVIAWFVISREKNDGTNSGFDVQLQNAVRDFNESLAAVYGYIEEQLNPTVHADPGVCIGDQCFEANITLDSSFAGQLPTSAYEGGGPTSWPAGGSAGEATTVAQFTP